MTTKTLVFSTVIDIITVEEGPYVFKALLEQQQRDA